MKYIICIQSGTILNYDLCRVVDEVFLTPEQEEMLEGSDSDIIQVAMESGLALPQ